MLVIETKQTTKGKGTPESPIRRLTEYFTPEGEALAVVDPQESDVMNSLLRLKGAARALVQSWDRSGKSAIDGKDDFTKRFMDAVENVKDDS